MKKNKTDLTELEERFMEWDSSQDPIDDFEEEDPDASDRKQALGHLKRILFMVVLGISIFSIFFTWQDLVYFMKSFQDPVELGNLREKIKTVKTLELDNNSYIKFSGAIVSREATSKSGKYSFFYCPLYKMIVQTEKDLPPKKHTLTVGIPEHLFYLVNGKKIFPFDLTASFAGEGRLYRALSAPSKLKDLIRYFLRQVDDPPEEVYFFVDGNKPVANWNYALLFVCSLFALLIGLIVLYRTYRRKQTNA